MFSPGSAESAKSAARRYLVPYCLERSVARIGPAKNVESCAPVWRKSKSAMLTPRIGMGKLNVPSYMAPPTIDMMRFRLLSSSTRSLPEAHHNDRGRGHV